MKAWVPILGVCGLAVASGFTVTDVRDQVQPKGRYSGLEAHETHASASLLGQFRTSISGWLWVRTDLYLHNGVVMRPLTEQEVAAGRSAHHAADQEESQALKEGSVVTVIPSADRDFRGVFGDIQRASSAYQDMTNHTHQSPKRALPLFRLMTWVDPNFVTGWTTGAAVLAMGKDTTSYPKAIEFLQQGLTHNPESIAILNQLGFTYATRLRKPAPAIIHLEKAREIGDRYDLKKIPEEEAEALLSVYRWLGLIYRESGDLKRMYEVLREGLGKFPGDPVLARMNDAAPLVLAPKKTNP